MASDEGAGTVPNQFPLSNSKTFTKNAAEGGAGDNDSGEAMLPLMKRRLVMEGK